MYDSRTPNHTSMSKFLVLYRAPIEGLDAWMQLPEETRKSQQETMQNEWNAWMKANAGSFPEPQAGAGKTKRVTVSGVEDVRNDIMLYGFVEAESHDAAAALFTGHPHFGIPGASIEVMTISSLPELS